MNNVASGIYDDRGGMKDVYIFLVGHSLGGGLAELAARSSYIRQVIAFNSSPVTAESLTPLVDNAARYSNSQAAAVAKLESLSKCGYQPVHRINSGDIEVNRVYESQDALRLPRLIDGWMSSQYRGKNTIEYKTNLLTGSGLERHSMKGLACALRR